jgi:hypothetical protein
MSMAIISTTKILESKQIQKRWKLFQVTLFIMYLLSHTLYPGFSLWISPNFFQYIKAAYFTGHLSWQLCLVH